jgi:hypothetical protein
MAVQSRPSGHEVGIALSIDFLLRAEDSTSAFGANIVTRPGMASG